MDNLYLGIIILDEICIFAKGLDSYLYYTILYYLYIYIYINNI
jgi:hypothetical protein